MRSNENNQRLDFKHPFPLPYRKYPTLRPVLKVDNSTLFSLCMWLYPYTKSLARIQISAYKHVLGVSHQRTDLANFLHNKRPREFFFLIKRVKCRIKGHKKKSLSHRCHKSLTQMNTRAFIIDCHVYCQRQNWRLLSLCSVMSLTVWQYFL